jgi:hypothetical protein
MSISRRIWYSKDLSFPSEFLNTILKLYQTSSVPEFNAHFSSLTTDRRRVCRPSSSLSHIDNCDYTLGISREPDHHPTYLRWRKHRVRATGSRCLWNAVVKTKTTPHILNTTTVPIQKINGKFNNGNTKVVGKKNDNSKQKSNISSKKDQKKSQSP